MTLDGLFSAIDAFFDDSQGGSSPVVDFDPFADADWTNAFGTAADFQVPAESGIDFSTVDSFGL